MYLNYFILHPASFSRLILEKMRRYEVEPNYGWLSIGHLSKTEKQLIICNTTVILLIQSRKQQLE
jgi:hypothetical protein